MKRVPGGEHGGEVEEGHVGLVVVVQSELEVGELVVGTVVARVSDVVVERVFAHIVGTQKFHGVFQILKKYLKVSEPN